MPGAKGKQRNARVARFHYAGDITTGTQLEMDKNASHHLGTVLRSNVGDAVILFNGNGNDYHATVIETGQRGTGKRCVLQIDTCIPGVPDSPLAITLVQCVSRPERMDISIRQAVELGVARIQPVYSRHSIKVTDEKRALKKRQHWQSIVTNACEQSGRAALPELLEPVSYSRWARQPKETDNVHFVLSPEASCSLTASIRDLSAVKPVNKASLIIGPESGLDTDEINDAIESGAVAVHLGRRILRTETAGPACIVLLQSILGDLNVC
ncbi:MAG: 16S rRNA (uracil(1498)-N(3))-methyltransferase [Granulosicoccus sp.]